MTMLRLESEMKDSGIEWYGTCPVSWKKAPLYSALTEINQKNDPVITTNILSLTNTEGVIPYSERGNQGNKSKENFEEYKVVYPNTIVANSMNILIGSVGLSSYKGCVSPVYYVYEAKPHHDIRYLNYLFGIEVFQKRLRQFANGIMEIRLRVSSHDILHQSVMIPTFEEQKAIADYLDEWRSKIDEIITEAEKSIEEYKALKQAVIFEAVTKGLDKNVPMKNTGNIWIPYLPTSVPLSRVSHHYTVILGKMLCPNKRDDKDTLEPYYCAANVHFDGISGGLKEMWFNPTEKEAYGVHEKDMLIVEGGAGAGGAAIVNTEPFRPTFVQNSVMIVRSKDSDDNRYLCYLVQALVKNKYVDFVCNKATIPHFTKEKVSNIPYPVWNYSKRVEIADYLDERVSQIDALIAEKQSLIEDLKAYKKSLIYEAVTGKRRIS